MEKPAVQPRKFVWGGLVSPIIEILDNGDWLGCEREKSPGAHTTRVLAMSKRFFKKDSYCMPPKF